ncbi:MAG: hypothetical protein R6U08_01760 [Bacillota bacterium]
MNRRGTGTIFCFIAAFLYAARNISAAIFGAGVSSWNRELFQAMLEYSGSTLLILSVIALVIGIVYLVAGEMEKQ